MPQQQTHIIMEPIASLYDAILTNGVHGHMKFVPYTKS